MNINSQIYFTIFLFVLFDCLVFWFFLGGGVYSYGDVSITGEWVHVFDLYLALVAIEQ